MPPKYRHGWSTWFAVMGVSLGFLIASGGTARADLITNGSFESTVLPPGSNLSVPNGSLVITGWTVLGNNVALMSSPYTEPPVLFNPHSGNQFVDISGFLNTMSDGIEQTVSTSIGQAYILSFYLGRSDILDPIGAILDLSINGGARVSYTNSDLTFNGMNWKQFSVNFTATSTSTTLSFFNGIPAGRGFVVGLDSVSLNEAIMDVPEPSSLLLFGIGMLCLLGSLCHRQILVCLRGIGHAMCPKGS